MVSDVADWRSHLELWLEPFLACLSHRARRRMCPLYVCGLIGPGERKSRTAHGAPPWDGGP